MTAPDTGDSGSGSTPLLFAPLAIRGARSRNRIMVSPMCMYSSTDGLANSYHLVHLGRFALGGAGVVVAEATAVEARGRISSFDLGLWTDEQGRALAPVAEFLRSYGAVPGIQLAHAGRKAATQKPWNGFGPLDAADAERGDPAWPVIGPSAVAAGPDWPVPAEMSHGDIATVVTAFRDAARRAADAGFELIELHGAHGYLLHSFLSPISNHRRDGYGGSLENRMRFAVEVVDAIREACPDDLALSFRLSSLDGVEGGLTVEHTSAFARTLHAHGVDVIDCSSGGVVADPRVDTRVRRGYAFHAPYSAAIRAASEALVATVGLIVDPQQAEAVLQAGDADVVALGRELLHDPNWPHHARLTLTGAGYDDWYTEAGWWLDKRSTQLRRLADAGETPMTRYSMTSRPMSAADPYELGVTTDAHERR